MEAIDLSGIDDTINMLTQFGEYAETLGNTTTLTNELFDQFSKDPNVTQVLYEIAVLNG